MGGKRTVWHGVLMAMAVMAASTSQAGMSVEEARSLTADIVLIKFEASVNICENLGATNLPQLYDAMRALSSLRSELVPTVDGKQINAAKLSYQRGLAQLKAPTVTQKDQIALICERTLAKIKDMQAEAFMRIVESGAKDYQQLFAKAQ